MQNTQSTSEISDPLKIAENFITTHFSVYQLLQCKDWQDCLPKEGTPILQSVYEWRGTVMALALQGNTAFPNPDVTFLEVAQECIPKL